MGIKRVLSGLLISFCFCTSGLYPDFGIRGGYLFSNFADGEYRNFSAFQAGMYIRFRISDRLTLEQEGNYVSFGLVDVLEDYDLKTLSPWELAAAAQDSRRDLSYLSLPFMLRYQLTNGEGIRPTVFAGGYVAIRLSRKYTGALPPDEHTDIWYLYRDSGTGMASGKEDLFYIEHRMLDFGLTAGAGAEKIIGKIIIGLDIRANMGLNNLSSEFSTLPNEIKKKNFSVALVLGIGIPVQMGL